MKYSFTFKNYAVAPLKDELEIIERCVKHGQAHQIEFDGKQYDMYYYTHTIDDIQYWVFVNNDSEGKTFDGTFRINSSVNLEDEQGKSEVEWNVCLKEKGETVVKKLYVKDPFVKCSVSYSSSYVVK